eukprot:10333565-Alexandrium_andersonii.AAC.1
MSASLVGSEMCIRDSARSPAWAQRQLGVAQRVANTAARRMGVDCYSPVSYTHLTLPTICSV